MPRAAVPDDKVNLRLILVSGKTKDFLFRPNESAGEIAQYVFDNWPVGKNLFTRICLLQGSILPTFYVQLLRR